MWAGGGQQGCCPRTVHTTRRPLRRTRPQVHRAPQIDRIYPQILLKTHNSLFIGLLISSLLHVVIAIATSVAPSFKPGAVGVRQLSVTLAPNMEKPAPQEPQQVPPIPKPSIRKNQQQSPTAPIKVADRPVPRVRPEKTKITPKTEATDHVEDSLPPRMEEIRGAWNRVKRTPGSSMATPQTRPEMTSASVSPPSGSSSIANEPDKTSGAQSAVITREQHYLAVLRERVEREKFYPPVSKRRGEEGQVVVGFVIRKDGELTDFTIIRSSGIRRLDNAALRTLRGISPFEPIPEILRRQEWTLSVPIVYSLSQNKTIKK